MLTGSNEGKDAVYCDTDSAYSLGTKSEGVGDNLGEWALEGAMRDFFALAPKTYSYTDEMGKEVIRAKGLSGISSADFKRFCGGGTVTNSRGVRGLRSAIRGDKGIFVRKTIQRSNKQDGTHFGDRILRGERTFPQTVKELTAWDYQ